MMEPRISNRHIDPHHNTSSESFRLCVRHGGDVSLVSVVQSRTGQSWETRLGLSCLHKLVDHETLHSVASRYMTIPSPLPLASYNLIMILTFLLYFQKPLCFSKYTVDSLNLMEVSDFWFHYRILIIALANAHYNNTPQSFVSIKHALHYYAKVVA